jgi:hypothetical protein
MEKTNVEEGRAAIALAAAKSKANPSTRYHWGTAGAMMQVSKRPLVDTLRAANGYA